MEYTHPLLNLPQKHQKQEEALSQTDLTWTEYSAFRSLFAAVCSSLGGSKQSLILRFRLHACPSISSGNGKADSG